MKPNIFIRSKIKATDQMGTHALFITLDQMAELGSDPIWSKTAESIQMRGLSGPNSEEKKTI